jgi:hypothetical protein
MARTRRQYIPPKRKNPFEIQISVKKQISETISNITLFEELIYHILTLLPPKDLKEFSFTSKLYYNTIQNEKIFCKILYQGIPTSILKNFQHLGGEALIDELEPHLDHFKFSEFEYFNQHLDFKIEPTGIYSYQHFEPAKESTNYVELFELTKILSSISFEIHDKESEKSLEYMGTSFAIQPIIIDTETTHNNPEIDSKKNTFGFFDELTRIKVNNPFTILDKLFYPSKCNVHPWEKFWEIHHDSISQENLGMKKLKEDMEKKFKKLSFAIIETSSSSCTSEFCFLLGEFGQYLAGFYFFVIEMNSNWNSIEGYYFNKDGEKETLSWKPNKKQKIQKDKINEF